ncbi:hypothetical protein HN935_00285 [archaeon]|jgi:hypothetical protein|nr:hypothetical protein [archaeon]
MSSVDVSMIAADPFISKFVFAIIQNIRAKNFDYDDRHVIHADMVPRASERVIHASLGEKITRRVPAMAPAVRKRDMSALVAPIARPRMRAPIQQVAPPVQAQTMAPPIQQAAPIVPQGMPPGLTQDYGKITPLLNDPSISTIECQGPGKPVMIIRAGQKQVTKIVLSGKDIKEVLDKVSDAAHIPLLEGVFRAAVDNFSINAVISEMIGSRFVIKKQTAYAMLER